MSSLSALNSLLSSASGSSSIDLSSILQAAFGASSPGLDVTAAVNSAITAAEAPENAWNSQISTLQNQIGALNQIQSDATNLDNDVQALNSVTGPLSAMTVNSSDSSILSATAASGSTPGNHVVTVNSLATTASWSSGTFSSGSANLPSGSFTITAGSGAKATINTDGTQSLSAVASQINGDNLGVTATVVTDATGARLAVVANSSGSAGNFSITGSTGYGFTPAVTGLNASLTVDGLSVTSASNSVAGVIPGLTLNLLSANPNEQVSLGVTPNTTQMTSAINQFVSDYNAVISDLAAQFTFNGTSEGVLSGDSTVRNLQSAMLSALDYTNTPSSGTTTIPNLSALGITVDNSGKLSVDSATLQNALQNNFSDVQTFFQGAALNGFANSLDQELTSFIGGGNGAFTVDLNNMSSEIGDLQTDITNFQTNYIQPLRAQLQNEYSKAEIALQQLPTEMKQISAELGQNNGSNG